MTRHSDKFLVSNHMQQDETRAEYTECYWHWDVQDAITNNEKVQHS